MLKLSFSNWELLKLLHQRRVKIQLSSALLCQEIKLVFIQKYNIYWSVHGKTRG